MCQFWALVPLLTSQLYVNFLLHYGLYCLNCLSSILTSTNYYSSNSWICLNKPQSIYRLQPCVTQGKRCYQRKWLHQISGRQWVQVTGSGGNMRATHWNWKLLYCPGKMFVFLGGCSLPLSLMYTFTLASVPTREARVSMEGTWRICLFCESGNPPENSEDSWINIALAKEFQYCKNTCIATFF